MVIKSNPKKNFTCIPNEIFADDRLSRKARFLLLELLSKPESWNLNYKHLVNSGREGEYAVRGGIEELLEAGYIHREATRQNGRISGIEYYVYDRAMSRDEHQVFVSGNQVEEEHHITPPEEYPNRQVELPFQEEKSSDIGEYSEKNHMLKTTMQKTTPIINTDSNQILKGETTTTTREPMSSYPAIADKNNLIDLIPQQFRTTMVEKIINRALLEHNLQEVEEAIKYAIANVKGGAWQFKAYLDRTLQNGWAEGYLESMAVQAPAIRRDPLAYIADRDQKNKSTSEASLFPARQTTNGITGMVRNNFSNHSGKYANGTITGSAHMDTNYQVAADFLKMMGVEP